MNALNETGYECLFCRGRFPSLPFYGCCAGCYLASAETRAKVDEAHPEPVQSGVTFETAVW